MVLEMIIEVNIIRVGYNWTAFSLIRSKAGSYCWDLDAVADVWLGGVSWRLK